MACGDTSLTGSRSFHCRWMDLVLVSLVVGSLVVVVEKIFQQVGGMTAMKGLRALCDEGGVARVRPYDWMCCRN